MAQTSLEVRIAQKDKLFILYRLKKRNGDNTVIGLDGDIIEAEAKMEQEDVALIREKVAELPD